MGGLLSKRSGLDLGEAGLLDPVAAVLSHGGPRELAPEELALRDLDGELRARGEEVLRELTRDLERLVALGLDREGLRAAAALAGHAYGRSLQRAGERDRERLVERRLRAIV